VALRTGAAGPHGGNRHAVLGFGLDGALRKATIKQNSRALLTQEVRNPRAGKYTFSIHASSGGSSAAYFRDVFLKHFTCRLVIYGFLDGQKSPLKVREFASVPFRPRFAENGGQGYEKFSLNAILRSQDDGAFELSRGVGVAVVVEKTTPGDLRLGPDGTPHQAFVRIDDVALEFTARRRNDDVQV
jgi:hypothetical protein